MKGQPNAWKVGAGPLRLPPRRGVSKERRINEALGHAWIDAYVAGPTGRRIPGTEGKGKQQG